MSVTLPAVDVLGVRARRREHEVKMVRRATFHLYHDMMRFAPAGCAALALLAAAVLISTRPAAAGTTPARAFADELRETVVPVFAKRAPKLALHRLTCVLAKSGSAPTRCQAHFRDRPATIYVAYGIDATVQQSGALTWKTTSRSCTSAKTGKRRSCPTAAIVRANGKLTPGQAFANQLKAKITPVFKQQAPQLELGKVTCVLPKNGNVVSCQAHFGYPSAHVNVVYGIKATLEQTGQLRWTTTSHACTNAKTGEKLPC
jgi:uncharacterized lipoprotein YbaY